jgi:hypothetical protein
VLVEVALRRKPGYSLLEFRRLHKLQFSGNIDCDASSRLAGMGELEMRICLFTRKGLKNEKRRADK